MPSPDYEKAKADCWDAFKILGGCEEVITKKTHSTMPSPKPTPSESKIRTERKC